MARLTNLGITTPETDDSDYAAKFAAIFEALDVLAPLAQFSVIEQEVPSTTLRVRIASGRFRDAAGAPVSFAGSASYLLPSSTTSRIWLDAAGATNHATTWPGTPHLPLATVVTDATTVLSITDERMPYTIASP